MFKCSITLGLVVIILGSIQPRPIHAGGQKWSVWIYDSDHADVMLLTNLAPTPEHTQLPLPEGYANSFDFPVAVSHDGRYIAYLPSTSDSIDTWFVYDRSERKLALNFPVPGLSLGSGAFSDTRASYAVGYSFDDPVNGGWEIKTFNLPDGSLGPVLRSKDSAAVTAQISSSYFMTPVIQNYRGSQITFEMIGTPSSPQSVNASYTWDTTTNQVRQIGAYLTSDLDTLNTGEMIFAQYAPDFPDCKNCETGEPYNLLRVYDPTISASFAFYTRADAVLSNPEFIQNGERIIFTAQNGSPGYCVLERSGTVVGCLPGSVNTEISYIGWQDGFLYLTSPDPASGQKPTLYEVNTRSGGINSGSVMWQSATPGKLSLIQVSGNMQFKGPFIAWRHL
jgi:hypothetical protein